jgi:hypothetical protein
MAALIVVALFWGNCLSCPQMLLTASAHQPAHRCCHKTAPATRCQSQGLQHFLKADPGMKAPTPSTAVVAAVEPASPISIPEGALIAPVAAGHAPPDLLSLHSVFRI